MGIDLGTSSLKVVVIDENGAVAAQGRQSYGIKSPGAGYAEQSPGTWWDACVWAVRQCLSSGNVSADQITAVSFSGQMHGTVALDESASVIRDAIIHCDVRSSAQADKIREMMREGNEDIYNPVFPGFQLTSLAWMRDREPELFGRIKTVLCPKDYLRLRMTGEIATDYSDASATLAFDIKKGCWDTGLLDKLSLPASLFPVCLESTDYAGRVTRAAAAETGLNEGTVVLAGGGDQAMQAIGNGVTEPGDATVTIGTGGQVLFPTTEPIADPELKTHTFFGPTRQTWYTMGAMLSAGVCLSRIKEMMFNDALGYREIDDAAEAQPLGSGGLLFLPYFNGERTPHMDAHARGVFFGLSLGNGKGALARSVMEGVSFGMYQCLLACTRLGLKPWRIVASGGAAHSRVWLQILSDVYGLPLWLNKVSEHAAVGAAIAAGVGAGVYADIKEGCHLVVKPADGGIEPNMKNHREYLSYFEIYKQLYETNKPIFKELASRVKIKLPKKTEV